MPEGLRAARAARGWSQDRLVREITRYAGDRAIPVANEASLKVYISHWENGRRAISGPYRAVLRALFGMTDAELFGGPAPEPPGDGEYAELASRIAAAQSIGPDAAGAFLAQTESFRTLDRQMGAAQLIDAMGRHLDTLATAVSFAVLPSARRPLAEALAGAASLAAWQALDTGAAGRAWQRYELAKQAGREAGQPRYVAHAMGEQAFVLADTGQTGLALDLISQALKIRTGVPRRLTAWLRGAQAEIHALAGDADACQRALDQAASALPDDDLLRDPDLPSIFLNHDHLSRWRGHSLALIGDSQAVANLYDTLAILDPTFARARAGLHCDLAQAHLIRGEHSEAADHLRSARTLASRTGSIRYRRRIEGLTYRYPS